MTIAVAAGLALMGTIGGKWYYTAAMEPVDPQRGIYGMAGLELWIDLNARMPAPLRDWGCTTLRSRENAALGGRNSLPPYGCQPGFGTQPDVALYDSIAASTLAQVTAGLDEARAATLRTCFDSRMASAVTPDEIAAANADAASPSMQKIVLAISEVARSCKAETP